MDIGALGVRPPAILGQEVGTEHRQGVMSVLVNLGILTAAVLDLNHQVQGLIPTIVHKHDKVKNMGSRNIPCDRTLAAPDCGA